MMIINPFEVINSCMEKAPVDVKGIIEKLNIEINFIDLGADLSGVIEQKKDGRYLICVNDKDHVNRQRFTMAHELGHYIYHRDKIGNGIEDNRMYRGIYNSDKYNNAIGNKEETQANQFAANLLMPWSLILKLRAENLSDDKIAESLQVSRAALKIRLEDFMS